MYTHTHILPSISIIYQHGINIPRLSALIDTSYLLSQGYSLITTQKKDKSMSPKIMTKNIKAQGFHLLTHTTTFPSFSC